MKGILLERVLFNLDQLDLEILIKLSRHDAFVSPPFKPILQFLFPPPPFYFTLCDAHAYLLWYMTKYQHKNKPLIKQITPCPHPYLLSQVVALDIVYGSPLGC